MFFVNYFNLDLDAILDHGELYQSARARKTVAAQRLSRAPLLPDVPA